MEDLTHKSTKKNTGTKQASQVTLPKSELEVLVSDYDECMTRCSLHIKMYKARCEISDVYISQAKEDFNNDTPLANITVCLMMDMMQKEAIPWLGSEQAGIAYYFSALTLMVTVFFPITRPRQSIVMSGRRATKGVARMRLFPAFTLISRKG